MAEIISKVICKIKVLGKILNSKLKWRGNIYRTEKLNGILAASREAVLEPRTLQDGALKKWRRTL